MFRLSRTHPNSSSHGIFGVLIPNGSRNGFAPYLSNLFHSWKIFRHNGRVNAVFLDEQMESLVAESNTANLPLSADDLGCDSTC